MEEQDQEQQQRLASMLVLQVLPAAVTVMLQLEYS